MRIIPLGESGLLVEFGDSIDKETNHRVHVINDKLKNSNIEGVNFTIPSFNSIAIDYNPLVSSFSEITNWVSDNVNEVSKKDDKPTLHIPVCYDSVYGPDLSLVAEMKNLENQDIVNLHTSGLYTVYMIGFLPGFPYMGILPKTLNMNRKKDPRLKVPMGSVGLAGLQTGIYPIEAPGGWQIIGRTPVRLFQPELENPFTFSAGDKVRFFSITKEEFLEYENREISRNELIEM